MTYSNEVDNYISKLPVWQQENLNQFRKLIHSTDSNIQEDIKWSVPVFIQSGRTVFAMSSFKEHTKFNFILNGALLENQKLFNNGLESNKSRGIDLKDGEFVGKDDLLVVIKQALEEVTQE
ncbi:hypothetical protein BH10PAT4_BH10PAT4_4880 [soil metagenome]